MLAYQRRAANKVLTQGGAPGHLDGHEDCKERPPARDLGRCRMSGLPADSIQTPQRNHLNLIRTPAPGGGNTILGCFKPQVCLVVYGSHRNCPVAVPSITGVPVQAGLAQTRGASPCAFGLSAGDVGRRRREVRVTNCWGRTARALSIWRYRDDRLKQPAEVAPALRLWEHGTSPPLSTCGD